MQHYELETFMGVVQRTGAGSKPCIPRVVSKSDRDHGTATTACTQNSWADARGYYLL